MNAGKVLEFLWVFAFCVFVIGVFVLPVVFSYWRHNERLRAKQTGKTLESLGFDTSGNHIYDA